MTAGQKCGFESFVSNASTPTYLPMPFSIGWLPIQESPCTGSGKSFTNIAWVLAKYRVEPTGTGIHVAGALKKWRAAFNRKRCELSARRDEHTAFGCRTLLALCEFNSWNQSQQPSLLRNRDKKPTDIISVALPQPNCYRVEIVASPRMLLLRSRAELAEAIPGRYRAATAKEPAQLPSYRTSPAKSSGFIAMNNAIMKPKARPTIVPAATPRQSIFCSPYVISHLQGLLPPYHYRTAIYQQLQASSQ